MRAFLVTGLAIAMLAGCESEDERLRFDGQLYRGKLSSDGENRRLFTASASPVSNSLEGARQALEQDQARALAEAHELGRVRQLMEFDV